MPSRPDDSPAAHDETAAHVAERIEDVHPQDAAQVMSHMSAADAAEVAEILDPETAGDVLAEMDPHAAADVIEKMEAPEASLVLSAMDADDRVDVLQQVEPGVQSQVMAEMAAEQAAETRQLQSYPPETAGGLMTTQFTALPATLTAEQSIDTLRRLNEQLTKMFYVYVVDSHAELIGVLSMRDLILARPSSRVGDFMRRNVVSIPATMDQEDVANAFRRLKYLAMPVVDEKNRIVGIVTVDDVVGVIEQETTEDVQKMFGAGAEERLSSSWFFSFRKRIGWLEVNLGTAFLAAAVVGVFESTITQLAILAAYMPIVAGMGGNASAQAMAVAIRGLAMGRVDRALMFRVVGRQFLVGLATGIICGLTTAIIAFFFHTSRTFEQNLALALVLVAALVFNHVLACTTGAAIPFIMKRLGFDPAQSSTIFATTVTDVAGFFALLGLAYTFLDYLK